MITAASRTSRALARSRTSPGGFTLVEMMLALIITSMITLTLAMMITSLGAASGHEQQTRRAMLQREIAAVRTGMVLRSPRMILARGADHLVLWQHDMNGNGLPDQSELLRLQWDEDAEELRTYLVPGDFDHALDVTYAPADNFSAITAGLIAAETFEESLILRRVTSFDTALDHGDAQQARLVRVRLNLDVDGTTEPLTITSMLRVPA